MSTVLAIQSKPRARGAVFCLSDVDWRMYSRLLASFGERRDVRLAYDRGDLEIMTPLLEHDDPAWFLGQLVVILTDELRLPIRGAGSTTLRDRRKQRGIEADETFWIRNAPRLAGRRKLDLRSDPPPDLTIEVDVTHSSLDRIAIYAALGVPELWHLRGNDLMFFVLESGGNYVTAPRSRSFPLIAPADLLPFVEESANASDLHRVLRKFRAWVRRRLKKKS